MKIIKFWQFAGLLLSFVLVSSSLFGQTKFVAKNNIHLVVSGTSTMHDWEMKSNDGDCNAVFTFDKDGKITGISSMSFSVAAKALKSDKGGMDKNAYKALKADKNPNITAVLSNGTVTTTDNKVYTIKGKINLTIAGKTVETDLVAEAKKVNDNSISVKGEKKISMKEFDMQPPSFMLGAVKTGNDVILHFNLILNQ